MPDCFSCLFNNSVVLVHICFDFVLCVMLMCRHRPSVCALFCFFASLLACLYVCLLVCVRSCVRVSFVLCVCESMRV